jgi:anti-anti-sigma factor
MSVAQSRLKSHTADFCAQPGPSGTVVTVLGELDAANANELTDYVEQFVHATDQLVLDLRGLEFVATAGFSALHRINVVCSSSQTRWVLVAGSTVRRLLRVCDPDGLLPTASPDDQSAESDGLFELIPQTR